MIDMKRALFITIGTRDVIISKEEIQQIADNESLAICFEKRPSGAEQMLAKPGGKLLLENIEALKDKLSFPIIEPFLKLMSAIGKPSFDYIFIIATDQQEDGSKYALNDTIYFAEILKKLLPLIYCDKKNNLIGKIEVLKVYKDVVYLDSMFAYFSKILKSKKIESLITFEEIHILNQGGIDAINYGLLFNALYLYGNRVRLYAVNEKTKLCAPLSFGGQFVQEQSKILLKQAIDRYDYAAIKDIPIIGDIQFLATYAEARLNFDFDTAAERLIKLSIEMRAEQEIELNDILQLRNNTTKLTIELYWNAMICYKQEAYVDFIQRLFRIVEQYAQIKALSYLKDFDYVPEKHMEWAAKFTALLEKPWYKELKEHLDKDTIGGKKLELDKASIPLLKSILTFYNPKEGEFINRLMMLTQLRNKGIGAHGFEPISFKQISSRMNISRKEFEKLLSQLGRKLKVEQNPFERINTIISDRLEKIG